MVERFADRTTLIEALLSQRLVRGVQALAAELANTVELCEVQIGQTLIQQGGNDNSVYFLLAGGYQIEVNGRPIAVRGPGEHVGEMAAILPSMRRSATVRATETGVVAKLSAANLLKLGDDFPSIWRQIAASLADRLFQRNSLVTSSHDRIAVFVISSSEGLHVARAVQDALAHDPFEVTLWTDGVFRASQYSVESLVSVLDGSDFAIAVAQPDDLVQTRGATHLAARDNVLFELGLFIGRLGRHRTFLLEPAESGLRLPSDLSGITTIPYRPGPEPALQALVGPACNQLRRLFREIGPK